MTRTFESPRSYDPTYSLLGRLLQSWTGDRLRGEALFVVVLTGLAVALLMSHYLGWALLKPTLVANPSWQMLFWAGQLASVVLLTAVGLVGIRPGVTVHCTPTGLDLEQGRRTHAVPYDAVEAVDTISPTRYHRHYRRYAATEVFVGSLADDNEVLLLRTPKGPVVVSLDDPEEQAALHAHLETAEADVPEPVPQPQS